MYKEKMSYCQFQQDFFFVVPYVRFNRIVSMSDTLAYCVWLDIIFRSNVVTFLPVKCSAYGLTLRAACNGTKKNIPTIACPKHLQEHAIPSAGNLTQEKSYAHGFSIRESSRVECLILSNVSAKL
jgi:hypothetical protein